MSTRFFRQYGCVRCQQVHTEGEPLFDEHLTWQSKHGVDRITETQLADQREAVQYFAAKAARATEPAEGTQPVSATQPMEDSTAAVRALDLPPKRERLGVVLVAPTQGGQAYQIDGGRLAPEMAAACVARDYSADAQEVAARYADWRILVMPPVALRAIPRASDLSARIFGVPVIELRAARTPEGGTHGG